MNGQRELPDLESLLHHRGTMLLLERLVEVDEDHACALARTDAGAWYADAEGAMPGWIGIELMAQAIAAHVAWSRVSKGLLPKQGVLLGTRAYHCDCPAFRGTLLVDARPVFRDDRGLGAYDCHITSNGQTVATATIKVYEPDDFQVFLNSQIGIA